MLEKLEEIWAKIVAFFEANVWNIIRFVSIFIIGYIVILIILKIIRSTLTRRKAEPLATRFFVNILRFALWLVLILILLASIGIEITGFTTALSAVVLAIGMALKDNISNLANGLILISSGKYKQGDYVVVAGVEGSIVDVNFLFTTLKTPDGKQITLPNSSMVLNPVTNFNAYEKRRVSYEIGVAYESDTELVKKIVLEVIHACGLTYEDPKPMCRLKKFENSSIIYFITFWVDTADYWDAYYEVLDNIYNEFKRNHIVIPYQQIEIRERKEPVVMPYRKENLPERIEKKRVKRTNFTIEDLEDMPFAKIKEIKEKNDIKQKELKQRLKNKKNSRKNNKKNNKKTSTK